MNRVFRYRLYPTTKQVVLLDAMLGEHCDLYNAALQERREAYLTQGTTVRYGHQSAQLKDVRRADPGGQGRWSFSCQQQTLRRLDKTFAAFFARIKRGDTPGYPRFRSRRRFDTVTFIHGDGGAWLHDRSRVRVQGVGHLKVKTHRPTRGTVKQFSITRQAKRWFVNVICARVPKRVRPLSGAVVGLDRGITHLVADSDGGFVANPRHLAAAADRLAAAQQDLARTRRGSNRRRKAAARVAAGHRKVAGSRRDHLHKVSRALVDTYDLIAAEGLKITNMTRSARGTVDAPGKSVAAKSGLNRSILDAGWGVLQNMLEYKAEEAGVQVVLVNPANTSRTCHQCGHVAKENRDGEVFRCVTCGHTAHADTNAARNILRLGLSLRQAAA